MYSAKLIKFLYALESKVQSREAGTDMVDKKAPARGKTMKGDMPVDISEL